MENKIITVAYKLYTIDEGERDFAEEATAQQPFTFISGLGMTLDDFEKQIAPLKTGDAFDFTLSVEQAYGPYSDEYVIELPKDCFLVNGKFDSEHVVPDAVLPLQNNEGQRFNGVVLEVKEDAVVMDLNHPMAGCELNFVGHVVESREATPEEYSRAVSMMTGGCGGGCGSCGGCGGESNGCGSCNCDGNCDE